MHWLMIGCVLIACMVVIGGITRLTGSGLSITEWKPIMGALPPMNAAEWEEAFAKYKAIPEYELVNQHMDLAGFKAIFFWEYLHRNWGRLMGLVFIVPFVAFWRKGLLKGWLFRRSIAILVGGGLVGADGHRRVQLEQADQQRRHQRAAAHAGQPAHEAHEKTGKDKSEFMHKAENVMALLMDSNYRFVLPLCE